MTPLQLHTYQTPNGHKAAIMLEETGLPYEVTVVDIERGDQRRAEYLAMNPNGKIPVLIDPDKQRTIFESGAILQYLAERSGQFFVRSEKERTDTLAWMFFQAAHVGPTFGQLWNYKIFAAERIPFVIDRFEREAQRVLNEQLIRHEYIVGKAYGLSDIMTWPWVRAGINELGLDLNEFVAVADWFRRIGQRPAVIAGVKVPQLPDHLATNAA